MKFSFLNVISLLKFIPDSWFSIIRYIVAHKKLPSLMGTTTFNEFLLNKKIGNIPHSEVETRKIISDRLLVREFVSNTNQHVTLVPFLWDGVNFTKDVWDDLPDTFVIKARHGSQMVKVVDKTNSNYDEIYDLTEVWKRHNYYLRGREWIYKDTPRELVVEQFISFGSDVPPDYKFFCSYGHVFIVQVDLSRFDNHKRNIYDRDFNLLPVEYIYGNGENIEKPKLFDEAINIAESLSKNFDFIRVDLYILDDEIYFGELTNFPENGLGKFNPKSFDQELYSIIFKNKQLNNK